MAAPGGVRDSKLVEKQVMYNLFSSDDDEGLPRLYKWLTIIIIILCFYNTMYLVQDFHYGVCGDLYKICTALGMGRIEYRMFFLNNERMFE